ncbi:hypothetical protein IFT35_14675 [Pantoea agglomerans]|jgi:hypothetical protein|uniref:hypothetical protein n=1 Tax=Enterobacter agglomerans TaxID=549 RepID=UPI00177D15A1|nr:hypothetical protein [Pantoea agglomerans]MBD8198162.1 hypothetical protein [Pantoea agglomerans]
MDVSRIAWSVWRSQYPTLPQTVSMSVNSTGRFSGKMAASLSPVQTSPTIAVLTVVMVRVPSLIYSTRTPW